jgi:mono/diheme cytochrome c family protein
MRPIHAVPAVLLVAAALGGCGGGGSGGDTNKAAASPATTQQQPAATQTTPPKTTTQAAKQGPDGAKVFASAGCASCHTLAAANASGTVGPNLDDLQPSFDAVQTQVANGGAGMPAFSGNLSSAEIDAVARYVADNAGR